jgi:uncharacterized protein (TIGR03435 family)
MRCEKMISRQRSVRPLIAATLASALLAQTQVKTPDSPGFDVVSIRPVPPNAPRVVRNQDFTPIKPGGQYVDSHAMLIFMISFAFNVRNPSKQLVGLPDWAKNQSFSVAAKVSAELPPMSTAENTEQVRAMMRKMLMERFRLQLHTEKREERVFKLRVAKGGIKLQESDPPEPPDKEGYVNAAMSDAGGRMIAKKATMKGMAKALAVFLRHPVIDETGSQAYYDFNLHWTSGEPVDKQAPGGFGSDGIALLLSNLRSQCGLQLISGKGPVDYWVVDHIEPPNEN